MRLSLEKKIIVLLAAFSALIAVIILAVIAPTIRQIKDLRRDTYALRTYLEKKLQRSARFHATLRKTAEIKKQAENFSRYLFHRGDELALITTLETLAAKNGVTQKIESSNLDSVSNNLITLSISTTGGFRNTLTYLTSIERIQYFINLQRLQLTPIFSRASPDQLDGVNGRFDLTLYVSE